MIKAKITNRGTFKGRLFKKSGSFSIEDWADAYCLFNNDKEFLDYIKKNSTRNIKTIKNLLPRIRVAVPLSPEEKTIAQVKKISSILDIKDNLTKEIIYKIRLAKSEKYGNDKVIKDFEELYQLLLAKAQGKITTKEIIAEYEVKVENGKIVEKKLLKRDFFGRDVNIINEKVVSHLPVGNDIKHMILIREAIESMKGRSDAFLTEQEREQQYIELLDKIEKEKERYLK